MRRMRTRQPRVFRCGQRDRQGFEVGGKSARPGSFPTLLRFACSAAVIKSQNIVPSCSDDAIDPAAVFEPHPGSCSGINMTPCHCHESRSFEMANPVADTHSPVLKISPSGGRIPSVESGCHRHRDAKKHLDSWPLCSQHKRAPIPSSPSGCWRKIPASTFAGIKFLHRGKP